jgi:hypothetical protein
MMDRLVSRVLPICPCCHDTKYVIAKERSPIKLEYGPISLLLCIKCDVEWEMIGFNSTFTKIR